MFYIPFLYTVFTRLNDYKKLGAWFFTYVVPFSIAFFFSYGLNSFFDVFSLLLCMLCIYSVYEVGYIYNDTETVKREHNPTLRLSPKQLSFYYENRMFVYLFRLVSSFVLVVCVYFQSPESFSSVLVSVVLILITYMIYNSLRSRVNIPLYSLLVFLRYYGSVLLVSPWWAVILIWLSHPALSTIEFASKSRFNLEFLRKQRLDNSFRCLYYLACCVILGFVVIACNLYRVHGIPFVCALFAYFAIYRVIGLLLSSWYKK